MPVVEFFNTCVNIGFRDKFYQIRARHGEVVDVFACHLSQRFFRPGEEPIDCAPAN